MTNFRNLGFTNKPRNPVFTTGKKFLKIPNYFSLVSANMANNDTIELGGPFSSSDRVDRLLTLNASPALTAAVTNLGFYKKDVNGNLTPVNTNADTALWSGTSTLASSQTTRDLLTSGNTSLDRTKSIGDLISIGPDSDPAGGIFVAIKFTTKPSADGVLDLELHVEESNPR